MKKKTEAKAANQSKKTILRLSRFMFCFFFENVELIYQINSLIDVDIIRGLYPSKKMVSSDTILIILQRYILQ